MATHTPPLASVPPAPRPVAELRTLRARNHRNARGELLDTPTVGQPVAIRVRGRGIVVTTPIVRVLRVADQPEFVVETERGNVYAIRILDALPPSQPLAAAEVHA